MSEPPALRRGRVTSPKLSLGRLLLLFVASRLLYLVLIDPSHWQIYPGEELYRGAIAQELVTGLKMPLTEYRADSYSGGSLVIGLLAAGFFLLFGPTVFALKLAPLLLFTLALVFWYWTVRRSAGERVAGYFAIMFCFAPPMFTDYSVTAMGFHSESIFFSALTVFLLFRMLSDETGSLASPTLLGLTAGVGLWFTYIYGLTLLAMLGFWFWQDTGMLRRTRFACFAIGFGVGFSPWILFNVQNHFAGLVIYETKVWEHFGLDYLWDGLSHPPRLAPYGFFAAIASDDPWDLYRRTVNLLYSILFLAPILTAGVLGLKTIRSEPAGPRPTRLTLVGFAILYLMVFALAVQFSDFRGARFNVPAYPFLFLLVAHSLARCQDMVPLVQRQIQTVFLASVILLGLGTHAPLLSLDRPGYAHSAKGYSYVLLPISYVDSHAPAGSDDREFILEVVQRPLLSSILPKLSPDDQQELSRGIALLLAHAAPLNGQADELSRFERLVPPGLDRHFYYWLGVRAMGQHPNGLPNAVAAVEFLRHRSAAAHYLALIGIYRSWARAAALDTSPEALASSPVAVTPELSPHYWRALGHLAGRYWYDTDQSLSKLSANLQAFVPRLDRSVQRYVLQGVGQALFPFPYRVGSHWVLPAELERFPQASQPSLFEGWGMELAEAELYSGVPWQGHESLFAIASTKGFSARSLVSVRQGKAQFDAFFEEPAPSALEPPRRAR